MTLRAQLTQLQTLFPLYRQGLTELVLGNIVWLPPRNISTVGGMPAKFIRLGLCDGAVGTYPVAILHYVDTAEVLVRSAADVAQWPAASIRPVPGLEEWLRRNVEGDLRMGV